MLFKLKGIKKLHLIGIGGSGMSGLAEILLSMGFKITGSDIKKTEVTERLEKLGCKIYYNHSPLNVKGANLVIISSAIKENNPEVREAKRLNIPIIRRLEMVAELTRAKYSICVSGAHGKGTVTSMTAKILEEAGFSPTIMIGGIIKGLGTGSFLGKGKFLVAEVDESDKYFLNLFPTIGVVTNIDREHLETYKNLKEVKKAFKEFLKRVPFYGCVIINGEDKNLLDIVKDIKRKIITFGLKEKFDIHPEKVELHGTYSVFNIKYDGENENIKINLPGKHNLLNALASISVAYELRISLKIVKKALEEFKGMHRRFEFKGEKKGIGWLDDYAHHPSEIRETLITCKNFWKKGRIIVIFQPHRYTRTYYLYKDFAKPLSISDILFLLPVYPAGEKKIKGVKSKLIYDEIKKIKKEVYLVNEKNLEEKIKKILKKGDLLVSLGAGDVWKIVENIFERL